MDADQLRTGMIVDCLDKPVGTLAAVRGRADAAMLVVRPPQGQGGDLVIPARYVERIQGNQVFLRLGCDEALRVGGGAGLETTAGESMTVPLVSETLRPVTRWQEAGAVEVRKTTRTETQELNVPRRYETATLERVPVNRVLAEDEVPAPRQEGETWIVPVVQEEIIAVKRRVLVEEVRITRQVHTTTEHIAESVRREEVEISHTGLEAHASNVSPAPPA